MTEDEEIRLSHLLKRMTFEDAARFIMKQRAEQLLKLQRIEAARKKRETEEMEQLADLLKNNSLEEASKIIMQQRQYSARAEAEAEKLSKIRAAREKLRRRKSDSDSEFERERFPHPPYRGRDRGPDFDI